MSKRLSILMLLALATAGCGSSSSSAPPVSTASHVPVSPAPITVTAYFLKDEKVAPVHVRVPAQPTVASAALTELLNAPPTGYSSALDPSSRLTHLSIADGTATVALDPEPTDERALAQIVYTLTQFPAVTSVDVGNFVGRTRADYEAATPVIFVDTPAAGDTVKSPIHIAGTSDTFEATMTLQVLAGGKKLAEQVVTATSGSGQRGDFAASVPVDATGPATIVLFEPSAQNGAPLHRVEIPVTIAG